jgi:hypothetical protein
MNEEEVLVKLNEGVSGDGNAFVTFGDSRAGARESGIEGRVRAMRYENPEGPTTPTSRSSRHGAAWSRSGS